MNKLITIAALLFILTGCNSSKGIDQKDKQQSLMNSDINHVDRKTGQQVSKRLVHLSTSLSGVHDATAVVLGPYAIVGIDVNSKLDRSQVGSIKYSVAEALRKDPYGAKAIVVADADTTARLKEINADIKKGRPIRGIMEELSDVAGRLMPEVPGDLITPNPKNATEKPDRKLSPKEQKNLEKRQEQQSNYHK